MKLIALAGDAEVNNSTQTGKVERFCSPTLQISQVRGNSCVEKIVLCH